MLYTGSLQIKKDRPNYYIVVDHYVDGKRKQKWVSTDIPVKGNHKRKAEARLREILGEYNTNGIEIAVKDVLFTDYIKQWLEDLKPSIELVTYVEQNPDAFLAEIGGHFNCSARTVSGFCATGIFSD